MSFCPMMPLPTVVSGIYIYIYIKYIYIYMKRFLSFNAFYPLKRLTYTCVFRIWYSPHSAALYNILFLFSHPHYTRYQVR